MRSVLLRPLRQMVHHCSFHKTVPTEHALEVGSQASDTRCISKKHLDVFGYLCGDLNPIHFSGIVNSDGRKLYIIHGAFLNALVSGVIGTKLPGPGTIVVSQNLRFPQPCFADEEITTTVQVTSVRKLVEVSFQCVVDVKSESPKIVLDGDAKLMLPKKPVKQQGQS